MGMIRCLIRSFRRFKGEYCSLTSFIDLRYEQTKSFEFSHALSVDDLGTILLVLIFGDPLGLKSGKRRESGTTAPDGVVSVRGGDDLHHVLLWAQGVELSLKSIWKSLVKGGSSGKDDVLVKILSNINIAVLDRLEGHGVHTRCLVSLLDEAWIEEGLWSQESWGVHGHGLAIWKLVVLLDLRGLGGLSFIGGNI